MKMAIPSEGEKQSHHHEWGILHIKKDWKVDFSSGESVKSKWTKSIGDGEKPRKRHYERIKPFVK